MVYKRNCQYLILMLLKFQFEVNECLKEEPFELKIEPFRLAEQHHPEPAPDQQAPDDG